MRRRSEVVPIGSDSSVSTTDSTATHIPGQKRAPFSRFKKTFDAGKATPKKARKWRHITKHTEQNVAAMEALGVPQRKIAKSLGLSTASVETIIKKPEVKEEILSIRETLRRVALDGVRRTAEGAWGWVGEAIQARDPRAFDAVTRGLAAMEKIGASASGESRQIQGQVTHDLGVISKEVEELLKAFLDGDRT